MGRSKPGEVTGKTNLFTGKLATYRLLPDALLEITGDHSMLSYRCPFPILSLVCH